MRFVIALAIFLYATTVLACTEPHSCGTSTQCDTHVKKFSTYTAFETWVNANQWTPFDIVYSSSTIIIVVTSENCLTKYTCWDASGECVQ